MNPSTSYPQLRFFIDESGTALSSPPIRYPRPLSSCLPPSVYLPPTLSQALSPKSRTGFNSKPAHSHRSSKSRPYSGAKARLRRQASVIQRNYALSSQQIYASVFRRDAWSEMSCEWFTNRSARHFSLTVPQPSVVYPPVRAVKCQHVMC